MYKYILLFLIPILFSCRSTKNIQKVIGKKADEKEIADLPSRLDTLRLVNNLLDSVNSKKALYSTFSAKIKVEYSNEKGKQPDFIANVRMRKDSLVWISIGNDIGIEGLRVLIDQDSIRIIDKLANTYQVRPVSSIQEISQLPFQLADLQGLLVGEPVFFNRDSILSYSGNTNTQTVLSTGTPFRHLLTVGMNYLLEKSKLDDESPVLNRTASIAYKEYEEKNTLFFSTLREIYISTKGTLGIKLKFKDYRFNEELTYPFTIPKKFKRIL